ncbi:hypothetical protein ACPF4J_003192 [Vibrio cholerae]
MEELLTKIHNVTDKLKSLKTLPSSESNKAMINAQEQELDSLRGFLARDEIREQKTYCSQSNF